LRKKNSSFTTQNLAIIGLLMAMDVILTRFIAIETPFARITFGFLPSAIIGSLFGPWISGTAGALTDLLGTILFNRGGTFFIGFTLSAFLGAAVYGFFLHRKEVKLQHIIGAVVVNALFVNLFLNTLWLVIMYGEAWRAILPIRILQNAIVSPVRVFLIYFILKQPSLKRIFERNSTAKK